MAKPASSKTKSVSIKKPSARGWHVARGAGSDSWTVKEPSASYGHWSSVIENVTGKVLRKPPTFAGIRDIINTGLERAAFDRIRAGTGVSTEELSSTTRIPQRTLSRRARFKPDETDRLLRVASAFQKAVEVHENLDTARTWFSSPQIALGGLTPLQCCDTEAGAKEVERLLGRIEYGVYT